MLLFEQSILRPLEHLFAIHMYGGENREKESI